MRMHTRRSNPSMTTTTPTDPWPLPELTRARRAVVVVDVVESVRLMQEDEAGFIDRWRRFVHQVRTEVLPPRGGKLVKSLGDGMLLVFEDVPSAVSAAFAAHRLGSVDPEHVQRSPAPRLRIGIHVSDVVEDDLDVYGAGVNLTARLVSLASPGDVVVSAAARDEVVDSLDCELSDMGDCFVKHVEQPILAWRASAPTSNPRADGLDRSAIGRPAIAVLPCVAEDATRVEAHVAHVIADDLVRAISKHHGLAVISPLSVNALISRNMRPSQAGQALAAGHLVCVRCRELVGSATVSIELIESAAEHVVWSDMRRTPMEDVTAGPLEFVVECAQSIAETLSEALEDIALCRPLPNVESRVLMLGSVIGIHRSSPLECERAGSGLLHLIERHPRAAEPHAWAAKWNMLKVAQRWTDRPDMAVRMARDHLSRALDLQPDLALALAIDGHTRAYAQGSLAEAHAQLRQAVAINPNEALAWMFLSNALANLDSGSEAVEAIGRARALALDPTAYLLDIFSAYASIAAGQFGDARIAAERSVRMNARHLPSLPVLIVAQVLDDDVTAARETVRRYRSLSPEASIDRYTERHRGSARLVSLCSDALAAAGLPR
jgi:adenylate cyclase